EVPPNCRFILGDCNTFLDDPSYEGAFDMIQARCIILGVFDYQKFLQHVRKALKPGGVFFAIEGRMGCLDEHYQPLGVQDQGDPAYSWQHKLVSLAQEAMVAHNDQVAHIADVPTWLRDMGDAWEEVGDHMIFLPIGPWNKGALTASILARNAAEPSEIYRVTATTTASARVSRGVGAEVDPECKERARGGPLQTLDKVGKLLGSETERGLK
ncbi:hypothetical protein FRC01_006901, partial [Tulasnella sp. 417]